MCSVDFSAHNDIRDVSFHLMLLVDFFFVVFCLFFLNHLYFYSDLMMKRVGTPSIGNAALSFSTAMGIYFNLDEKEIQLKNVDRREPPPSVLRSNPYFL